MTSKKIPTNQSAYTSSSQSPSMNGTYQRQNALSQYSRSNPNYAASRKKVDRTKKIAIGVFAAVLVVIIGAGSAFALWKNALNDELTRGNKSDQEIAAINDALKSDRDMTFTKPFYMMLIGTDEAEDSEGDMYRSDTNIVVRVDPTKNQAIMVSIPRDTKIELEGHGTNKFNAAYSYDGAAGALREASKLLDVEISHYAEVNFGMLKDLVDAVGGVDVEVPELVDDPDADGTSAHPEWPRVIIEPGEQHLDGNQALVFARSRAYADGDFTRTANQRALIMAIVNKVLALNPADLFGAIQAAAKCVTTDLAVGDIAALAQQFQDEGELEIYSAMVPSGIEEMRDAMGNLVASYVINDPEATKEMMKLVEAGEDPSSVVSDGMMSSSVVGDAGYDSNMGYDAGAVVETYDAGGYVDTWSGGDNASGSYDPGYVAPAAPPAAPPAPETGIAPSNGGGVDTTAGAATPSAGGYDEGANAPVAPAAGADPAANAAA